MLNLFALPPKDDQRIEFVSRDAFQLARTDGEEAEEQEAEEDNFTSSRLIKRDRVYYVQNPEAVNDLLSVERYAARWPLKPTSELHASSVQHPLRPEWRWLLHSRRVPVKDIATASASSAAQPADSRPRCAGIGDDNCHVWSCWDCLMDIVKKKAENACARLCERQLAWQRARAREGSIHSH